MKKHELIKHAYDNYQKGTKFTPPYMSTEYISTGIFNVLSDGDVEMIHPETGKATVLVMCGQEWAEIIPEKPSILDGKVYIALTNKREFDLYCAYHNEKGWTSARSKYESWGTGVIYALHGALHMTLNDPVRFDEGKVIPFSDFAAEVGIKVPKLIMKSEDGVDLYEGDDVHWSINDAHDIGGQKWRYLYGTTINEGHLNLSDKGFKVFSTKEAAKAWIKEQNKPKEITISINDQFPTKVVYGGAEISTEHGKLFVTGRELEEIYAAYKSLNGKGKEVTNGNT